MIEMWIARKFKAVFSQFLKLKKKIKLLKATIILNYENMEIKMDLIN